MAPALPSHSSGMAGFERTVVMVWKATLLALLVVTFICFGAAARRGEHRPAPASWSMPANAVTPYMPPARLTG
jgi:hypothetical protein